MTLPGGATAAFLLATLALTAAPTASSARIVPDCGAQLSVAFAADDGARGMSHAGAVLVVRNHGAACRTPGLPSLRFENRAGDALAIVRDVPRGMHPGPVIVPIVLGRGSAATAELYWVSNDVYDGGRCVKPARVVVTTGSTKTASRWSFGQICGPAGTPVRYRQRPLTNRARPY